MNLKNLLIREQKGIADRYFDLKSPPVSMLMGGERGNLQNEYTQLPIVYAVINAKSRRAASVPPKFYRRGTETEVTHPAIDRLMRPSYGLTFQQFVQTWVIQKEMRGEFLSVKASEVQQQVPISVKPQKYGDYEPWFSDAGELLGWLVKKEKVETERVIYDRYVNPWSDTRGLSPLDAARVSNETEWSARRFNKKFFDNDATPGGYFNAPNGLTERQRQELKHELIESRKGAENSHSWILLEGETSIESMGLSQRDAQFIEQFGLTLHDICAVYGVDPAIIGFEKESKYASAKEARRYMWTDVVIPTLNNIEGVLNEQYFKPYNIEMFFDTSNVDALSSNLTEQVAAAEKLYQMGVPFNMINERLELGFEEIPGGDDPKPSGSPMMFDHEPEAKKEAVIGPQVAEGPVSHGEMTRAVDGVVIKAINDPVDKLVGGLNRKLKRYFFDAKKLLERSAKSWSGVQTKDINDEIIDDAISFERLSEIILEFLTDAGVIGWKQITGENVSRLNPPQAVLNMVGERAGMIKQITENARAEVRAKVREAIEEGLPERELEQRLLDSLSDSIDNLQSRAGTIARTEVHTAHSRARMRAMSDTGAIAKRWVAAGDARESHQDNAARGVVAWDEGYPGGLRYPLDPNGHDPGEIINCRCALVPYYEGEVEAERFINE